ncbi:MAG: flavin reductase family protein [Gammaproteobacteria bacterium]|nr:flavin reductase family protein [Gammaproteobacteria bacterium]MBU1506070.1 flavin reductase family protein [Gammaproteobacteria bacterium]MBU2119699.1 flavin reductase family protein [Gammaproteobacteria bacterium]MBU2170271.1 flavin reductase family protein [Gammaproteobacteria bacterium]MBU2202886.1 flavin reductase family protein [Gammaproteobacteria bacterium]
MPTTAPEHFTPVPLNKAYRLLNHGPTVLVSAAHAGQHNVMAAAWACALDFSPPKVTVVIDKATRTRELVEGSGTFALQLPTLAMAAMTVAIGTDSAKTHPDKLQQHGVELFYAPSHPTAPLVQGCAAWLVCRVIPEPHNQQTYDLFIGEVVAAWADERVFRNGHWEFDTAPDELRTLHYVAGGQFYATGASVNVA